MLVNFANDSFAFQNETILVHHFLLGTRHCPSPPESGWSLPRVADCNGEKEKRRKKLGDAQEKRKEKCAERNIFIFINNIGNQNVPHRFIPSLSPS
jgi:hypothetical protein